MPAASTTPKADGLPLELVLYETSHCHLCEDAQALLRPWAEQGICRVELVDIVDDTRLLDCYGQRIPVLHHPASGAELDWPFTPAQADHWLRQQAALIERHQSQA